MYTHLPQTVECGFQNSYLPGPPPSTSNSIFTTLIRQIYSLLAAKESTYVNNLLLVLAETYDLAFEGLT